MSGQVKSLTIIDPHVPKIQHPCMDHSKLRFEGGHVRVGVVGVEVRVCCLSACRCTDPFTGASVLVSRRVIDLPHGASVGGLDVTTDASTMTEVIDIIRDIPPPPTRCT